MSDFSISKRDQINEVLVRVPSKREIAWVFVAAIPVLAIGIMSGMEAIRWFVEPVGSLVMASISALSIFCGIWYPVQVVKQRRVAIEVNSWQPKELR